MRFAKAIVDYIFQWMAAKFLSPEAQYRAGVNVQETVTTPEQLTLDVAALATAPVAVKPGPVASKFLIHAEPGRRATMLHLRFDHGAVRRVLQVRELRHDQRLRVGSSVKSPWSRVRCGTA